MEKLRGTGVAIVTPFLEDGSLDLDGLRRVVNFCIEGGNDYLVVLGTTGESVTLDEDEKRQVRETVIDENASRVPLVIGIGGNNTAKLVKELLDTDLEGFDAVLSVSPYYNKPTQEGIFQHFKTLSEASPKPVIIYNVPGRTASNILPSTVVRIANNCQNIIGIKEASGDLTQVQQLIKSVPEKFLVISGDDITALPSVLAGGAGVISVLGQAVPVEFTKMINLGLAGDDKSAYALHHKLKKGMELIFEEGNPAGIKAMLQHLKLIGPSVRLPLMEASDELKAGIGEFADGLVNMPV